jgi:two-component system NtrC family response regulator
LRKRKEDILLLAEVLLRRYAAESRRRLASFSRAASTALQTYHWPGNVRELENRIKRAVIMADGPAVQPEDLDLSRPSDLRQAFSLRAAREAVERDLIQQALVRQHGNLSRVAADLGVSRPTLYELLEKLGIKRNACKGVGLPRNLGGEET